MAAMGAVTLAIRLESDYCLPLPRSSCQPELCLLMLRVVVNTEIAYASIDHSTSAITLARGVDTDASAYMGSGL